jgi:transcriptional regulator with XRE-family HTH domain
MPEQRQRSVGELLRGWRERRRLSQLELAGQAEVSTRHLSFVETGRSAPSRQMLLHLAEQLDVPLRERNQLLLAAGYAPFYSEAPLDSPALAPMQLALKQVLNGHEPYPALVVDRLWNLLDANAAIEMLIAGSAEHLLKPPINVLRLSLHPEGLAPRIINLAEWRSHLLGRLHRQATNSADPELHWLYDELVAYPSGGATVDPAVAPLTDVVVPLRLRVGTTELSFLSMVSTFGTPVDITLAELSIESFFPADPETTAFLQSAGQAGAGERAGAERLTAPAGRAARTVAG